MGAQPTTVAARQPCKSRRSQGERSRQMRIRLIEAAIESLARDGYAGSSLSSITRTAAVSRGAQSHHFPTKEALLYAVVDHIGAAVRNRLREIMTIEQAPVCRRRVAELLWQQIFSGNLFSAYIELLIASQRSAGLQAAMQKAFISNHAEHFPLREADFPALEVLLYLSGAGLHSRWLSPSRIFADGLFTAICDPVRHHQATTDCSG